MSKGRNIVKRLLLLSLAFLTACGSSDDASSGAAGGDAITIGFSQVGSESGWRTSFTESVQAEAARRGIDLEPFEKRLVHMANSRIIIENQTRLPKCIEDLCRELAMVRQSIHSIIPHHQTT